MKISLPSLLQASRRLALPLLGAAALGLSGCVGTGFETVSYRAAYYDEPSPYYYGGTYGGPYYYGGGYYSGTRVVGRTYARPGVRKYARPGYRNYRGSRNYSVRAPRQAPAPRVSAPNPSAPRLVPNRR